MGGKVEGTELTVGDGLATGYTRVGRSKVETVEAGLAEYGIAVGETADTVGDI